MGVTMQATKGKITLDKRINNGQPLEYISRLQCVQTAIHAQLETIKKEDPNCVVVLVEFHSDVIVHTPIKKEKFSGR